MSPVGLDKLLESLPQIQDNKLLVGYNTSDDAAVYRLDDENALVLTADIITPPVDDPALFGQIAAANALSDVYAMGGRPLICLNIVGFPAGKLPQETLHGIVAGALSKVTEAGALLAGGHTTDDEEPKFGLAVAGLVHPDRVWTNAGARDGDALILTKPIGSGVLFNANLKGWVSSDALNSCIETLVMLNRTAAETLRDFEPHAVTDVTGFGLAGHAYEMARASNTAFQIEVDAIPVMDEALAMYKRGMTTGVNPANREMAGDQLRIEGIRPGWHEEILFDPQTSGGLLIALPEETADALLRELHARGVAHAARIGRVTRAAEGQVRFS